MIQFKNIKKSFYSNHVLRGINLKIDCGESMVIIGGSGTGKSVLIKTVLGLILPDSGQIFIDGVDVTKTKNEAFFEKFGMLFQGGALFDSLTVWQNVAFRLLRGSKKLSQTESKKIAIQKLRRVGLSPDIANRYPAELSGGMQKRVSLARAIATNPEVIFFDEPTTGLDPIMSRVINELIREVVVELGVTAITITHDMASVTAIADKVAMLHKGKIQWCGAKKDLQMSDNAYVSQFINGAVNGPIETLQ